MTLDEARLMASVNDRARRLFEDGYRARWNGADRLEVRNGRGSVYAVDTRARACDCPFYQAHQGRYPCKHSLGWRRLLCRQRACRRLVALLLLRAWADLDDGAPPASRRIRTMPETTMPETADAPAGGPLFPLGRTVATPGALDALNLAGVAPGALLDRHARGDWGELGEDDRRANGQALLAGGRLLSAYALPDGVRVWVITEADRSATTLLLPEEY